MFFVYIIACVINLADQHEATRDMPDFYALDLSSLGPNTCMGHNLQYLLVHE